jgi:hypothetical protein
MPIGMMSDFRWVFPQVFGNRFVCRKASPKTIAAATATFKDR